MYTKLYQYYTQEGVHFYFLRLLTFSLSHRISLLNFRKAVVTVGLFSEGSNHLSAIKNGNSFVFNEVNAKLSVGFLK